LSKGFGQSGVVGYIRYTVGIQSDNCGDKIDLTKTTACIGGVYCFKAIATAPSNPTAITSSSHTLSTWSKNNTVNVSWSGASDGSGSGVYGYSREWSTSPITLPDTTVDTSGTASTSPALATGTSAQVYLYKNKVI